MESEFLKKIEEKIKEQKIKPLKDEERELFWVNRTNSQKGDSSLYNCEKCNSKGFIAFLNDKGKYDTRMCDCYNKRENRKKLRQLGLLKYIDQNNSFDDYIAKETWQILTKEKAIDYVNNGGDKWFFIGGNVGTGKTKLCTIIISQLLDKYNKTIGFLSWDSEYKELVFKDNLNAKINYYKQVDILYIDDFFRLSTISEIKDMERDLAKSIIDYRYRNNLITIISSELNYNEIEKLDVAIASRIYEMAGYGKYILSQKRDANRNVRKNIELI